MFPKTRESLNFAAFILEVMCEVLVLNNHEEKLPLRLPACAGNATRLLVAQRSSIGLLTVKTERFEVIARPGTDPVALAFDVARGWYFWADRHGSIYKSDGGHSSTIHTGQFRS